MGILLPRDALAADGGIAHRSSVARRVRDATQVASLPSASIPIARRTKESAPPHIWARRFFLERAMGIEPT